MGVPSISLITWLFLLPSLHDFVWISIQIPEGMDGPMKHEISARCQTSRSMKQSIPQIYLKSSGVWQNDWETRPPPGNYSTASDTWIQVSTNKMLAPDYACWRSNNSHRDVIMSRLWLWWSWRPHNLRFRKAQCISSSAALCGRPKIGP